MTDYIKLYTPDQDLQVVTGAGHLPGVIVTSTSATSTACTIFDYAGPGPAPASSKIFEVVLNASTPLVILFNDRFAPRFHDGVWLTLGENLYATLYVHVRG